MATPTGLTGAASGGCDSGVAVESITTARELAAALPGSFFDADEMEEAQWPVANCNDFFYWACADGEELTDADVPAALKAIADCETALAGTGTLWGVSLWVCRKRGSRPQGGWYATSGYWKDREGGIPKALYSLFNACGPHRKSEFGNPYATPEAE